MSLPHGTILGNLHTFIHSSANQRPNPDCTLRLDFLFLDLVLLRLDFFLVLFGVVTAIFFLFSAKPGDPSLMAGGNHATAEVIQNISPQSIFKDPVIMTPTGTIRRTPKGGAQIAAPK